MKRLVKIGENNIYYINNKYYLVKGRLRILKEEFDRKNIIFECEKIQDMYDYIRGIK